MNSVIFVADFFDNEIVGGAELHDRVVIDFFKENGILFEYKKCVDVTLDYIRDNEHRVWFISNFVSLNNRIKALLAKKCKYFIYEHDYKFCRLRNPISYPDFVAPRHEIINYNFYAHAQRVICLSKRHRDIFVKNLNLSNICNINCSMWSDEQLGIFERLQDVQKNGKFAVMNSSNPTKKTYEAVQFCRDNNIDYDLIPTMKYEEFIQTLSSYEGLVFRTGHPEPTPRVAIECKMLGCKFMAQKELIGVAYEDYFSLLGSDMIEKVRDMRNKSLNLYLDWVANV